MIYTPAELPQFGRDHAIAIAGMLAGKRLDLGRQGSISLHLVGLTALRHSRLLDYLTSPAFGNVHRLLYVVDRLTLRSRAQYFPANTSFKIALSSDKSATNFFNCVFSF